MTRSLPDHSNAGPWHATCEGCGHDWITRTPPADGEQCEICDSEDISVETDERQADA